MGRGKGGRSRTQRKHFHQSRENVWKQQNRPQSDSDPSSTPYDTQNPAFDHYYKACLINYHCYQLFAFLFLLISVTFLFFFNFPGAENRVPRRMGIVCASSQNSVALSIQNQFLVGTFHFNILLDSYQLLHCLVSSY